MLCAACSDDDQRASISGKVSENVVGWKGEVTYLKNVKVELTGSGVKQSTVTNAIGEYSFSGLQTGAYTLTYTFDNYTTADTLLHIYKEVNYSVPMTLRFNFSDAKGLDWSCTPDNLVLTLMDNMFTLKESSKVIYSGFYESNDDATLLTFHASNPESVDFEADYLGDGAIYLFTPVAIHGKTRFCFYKNS
jgi:hypothetical protein